MLWLKQVKVLAKLVSPTYDELIYKLITTLMTKVLEINFSAQCLTFRPINSNLL